jgi:hypothetical protein
MIHRHCICKDNHSGEEWAVEFTSLDAGFAGISREDFDRQGGLTAEQASRVIASCNIAQANHKGEFTYRMEAHQ